MTTITLCANLFLALANGLTIEECVIHYPPYWELSPMTGEPLPILFTNYTPLNDDGTCDNWNGQADSDCKYTANMTPLTLDSVWSVAACPYEWVRYNYTTHIEFMYNGELVHLICNDNFGDPSYRQPQCFDEHPHIDVEKYPCVLRGDIVTLEGEMIYLLITNYTTHIGRTDGH